VYAIAAQVRAQLQADRPVALVRTIAVEGMSSRWEGDSLAVWATGRAGGLIGGAADAQLTDPLAAAAAGAAETVSLRITDADANAVGLACGGTARLLLQPAAQLPTEVWDRLIARQPVCLLTDEGGATPGRTTWFAPAAPADERHPAELVRWFGRGMTSTSTITLADGTTAFAMALWPISRLLVVGDGLLADALLAQAALLGWDASATVELTGALEAVRQLTPADALVVLTHDREVDGPVLESALGAGARAGYIGALGSRRTQAARAGWLAERGVGEDRVAAVHGPAGLDIGARTPAEIAVAITAEVLAARSGTSGAGLRTRGGPIHTDGLNTPPARYPEGA
jgi:xanthine dehydrogenase accessory factor